MSFLIISVQNFWFILACLVFFDIEISLFGKLSLLSAFSNKLALLEILILFDCRVSHVFLIEWGVKYSKVCTKLAEEACGISYGWDVYTWVLKQKRRELSWIIYFPRFQQLFSQKALFCWIITSSQRYLCCSWILLILIWRTGTVSFKQAKLHAVFKGKEAILLKIFIEKKKLYHFFKYHIIISY